MTPQPGHAVRTATGTGYISAVLADGTVLGCVSDTHGGYVPLPAAEVTVVGPHPVQWDKLEWQRHQP